MTDEHRIPHRSAHDSCVKSSIDHHGIIKAVHAAHAENDFAAVRSWIDYALRINPDNAFLQSVLISFCMDHHYLALADRLIEHSAREFPDKEGPFMLRAALAGRIDQNKAIDLWQEARRHFPQSWWGLAGMVSALFALSRPDEAISLAEQALRRPENPYNPHRIALQLQLHEFRAEWAEMETLLDGLHRFEPQNAEYKKLRDHARNQKNLTEAAAAGSAGPESPAIFGGEILNPLEQMAVQIESLGSTCEFGLVQRHLGIENLGLLRWSAVSIGSLTTALTDRFKALENPGLYETRIKYAGESQMHHLPYDITFHSFIHQTEAAKLPDFHNRQVRQLCFLRDKLIRDVQQADKLFIFTQPVASIDEINALHHALSEIGPARLLVVQNANSACSSGTVVQSHPGLLIGYISKLAVSPVGNHAIDFHTWRKILIQALKISARRKDLRDVG